MASDPLGVAGRAMLEALVAGAHDPRCWPSWLGAAGGQAAGVAGARQGRFGARHGLLVTEMLARIDQLDETIERLSAEVARVAAPCSALLGCW